MLIDTNVAAQAEGNKTLEGTDFDFTELTAEVLALVGGGEGVVITT